MFTPASYKEKANTSERNSLTQVLSLLSYITPYLQGKMEQSILPVQILHM